MPPSAILAARRSIGSRRAARTIGTGSAGGAASLNPPSPRSPASTVRRYANGLLDLRQRAAERDAVPPFDDHVRRGAEAEDEAAVARVGERERALRQQRRPAGVDVDDARDEADAFRVLSRHRKRCEPVVVRRLGRPETVVARVLGAFRERP